MALTDDQQQEIYDILHSARLIRSVDWAKVDKAAWSVLAYLVPAALADKDESNIDTSALVDMIKALPQQTVAAIKAAL